MASEFQLADLCELIVDCPHSTPAWKDEGVVVLRSQNIRGGRLDLSQRSFTDEATYLLRSRRATLRGGDIVLTREAPMGEVAMVPPGLRCCLGQRMVLLRPDPKRVDGRFLLYALQSPFVQHWIRVNEGTGSTVSNLRIPVLEALKIPCPPLEEQPGLADILWSIEERIGLIQRTSHLLEAIVGSIFKSWFVDFDPVRAKAEGREPEGMDAATAALFPSKLSSANGQEAPEGWSTGPLERLIELAYGKALKAEIRREGRYPVIGSNGVVGTHDVALVSGPGIVVGRKGTAGAVHWIADDFFPIDTTFYVIAKDNNTLEFIYQTLRRANLPDLTSDSAVPGLNRDAAYSVELVIAPLHVRQAFTLRTEALRKKIEHNREFAATLAKLRDTLLPKLMSGQIRIPEAEKMMGKAL